MSTELDKLVAAARLVTMTPQQQEAQRRSFAYGNTNIENSRVTREVIERAAKTIETNGR